MRRVMMHLLMLALMVGACGDSSSEPKIPEMTGSWTGTSTLSSGGTFTLSMTITESERSVTGSGSITVAGTTVAALTVSGSHVHPDVLLTLRSSGFTDMNFSGEFTSDNAIRGQLDGSGFASQAIMMNRSTAR